MLHSCGCGSLTLTIMSALAKISAALPAINAPAAIYCSSDKPIAAPAFFSTLTRWPHEVSSRTLAGVRPTRYSLFFISFGTPIHIVLSLFIPIVLQEARPVCGRPPWLFDCLEDAGKLAEQLVNVFFLKDQRRGQRDDVAGHADQDALRERALERIHSTSAGLPGDGGQFDPGDQADVAQVDHVR